MTESHIQQQIVLWFNNKYCLKSNENRSVILSIPNDSFDYLETKRKLNTGLLPGASDLIILLPNAKTIFVEVKFENNKQSEKQIEFQERVEKLGFQYWLVKSLEQFQQLVENENIYNI